MDAGEKVSRRIAKRNVLRSAQWSASLEARPKLIITRNLASHAADRSKSRQRSRLLPGVDGRSAWMRRCKDIIAAHVRDLGGEDNISAAECSIIRRASVMTVELERLEAKFAAAGGASERDLDLYIRAAGNLRRLLETIGLQRRVLAATAGAAWSPAGTPKFDKGSAVPIVQRPPPKTRINEIRDLCMRAMQRYGYDGQGMGGAEGYMTMVQRFPLQYMCILLAKMMPQEASVDANVTVDLNKPYETIEQDMGAMGAPLEILIRQDDPPLLIEEDYKDGRQDGN
jgi:hypothetical protein